jgi:hypothetical protein
MSQSQPIFPGSNYTEKQLELVKTILEKTRQEKIVWLKFAAGYLSVSTAPLRLQFDSSSGTWQSFRVFHGTKQLLKVDNNPLTGVIGEMVGLRADPVLAAINELFRVVARGEFADVDSAIDALKRL